MAFAAYSFLLWILSLRNWFLKITYSFLQLFNTFVHLNNLSILSLCFNVEEYFCSNTWR